MWWVYSVLEKKSPYVGFKYENSPNNKETLRSDQGVNQVEIVTKTRTTLVLLLYILILLYYPKFGPFGYTLYNGVVSLYMVSAI